MSAAVVFGGSPLWSKGDAGRLGLLVAAGAGVIAASWFSAAGRPDAGDQLVFVSLSLLGALVGLAAVFGWVRRGRRAVGARTRLLLGSAPAASMDIPAAGELVAGPGATWFHRADCLLVDGRKVTVFPLGAHQAAGRRACGACKPCPGPGVSPSWQGPGVSPSCPGPGVSPSWQGPGVSPS